MAVKDNGDDALLDYTEKFDGVKIDSLLVSKQELDNANAQISEELSIAIKLAKSNIEKFHNAQHISEPRIETTKGISCWRKSVGIEKGGLYIPGGSAPLFSTILMLAIPAKIAGCDEIVLCTPPNSEGTINPAILYTANLIGVSKIYKVGGAQSNCTMAFGQNQSQKFIRYLGQEPIRDQSKRTDSTGGCRHRYARWP